MSGAKDTGCNKANPNRPGRMWACQLAEARQAAGIPEGVQPWTPHTQVPATDRAKGLMDLVAAEHLGRANWNIPFEEKQKRLQNIYLDISQNPKFKSCTNAQGITGCLSTSTALYSYGQDRMLLPVELLYIQGHSRTLEVPDLLTGSQIRDLAGEGICLPCLGTLVWAAYLIKGLR